MKKHFDFRDGAISRTSIFKKLFFIILLIHLTGCSFQGRKYTRGHFWESGTKNENEYEKRNGNEELKKNEKENGNEVRNENENENENAIKIDSKSIVKDTLKTSSFGKNSIKRQGQKQKLQSTQEQEIQLDEKKDLDRDEKKLRRAKKGFVTFWVIESLFYLGLLGNAFSPDVWGFWLAIFGILTVFYLIPVLIYMAVMQRRYSRSKDHIKDELLKAKIPKLIRTFIWAMLIEVVLFILAFIHGWNL